MDLLANDFVLISHKKENIRILELIWHLYKSTQNYVRKQHTQHASTLKNYPEEKDIEQELDVEGDSGSVSPLPL